MPDARDESFPDAPENPRNLKRSSETRAQHTARKPVGTAVPDRDACKAGAKELTR